jgi:hypothetical protein
LGWILGAKSSHWSKFHSNSKFKEETILDSIKFQPRNLSEFSFKILSESEEVSMEEVVHLFEIFKTIFYFQFLKLRKVAFGLVKV